MPTTWYPFSVLETGRMSRAAIADGISDRLARPLRKTDQENHLLQTQMIFLGRALVRDCELRDCSACPQPQPANHPEDDKRAPTVEFASPVQSDCPRKPSK